MTGREGGEQAEGEVKRNERRESTRERTKQTMEEVKDIDERWQKKMGRGMRQEKLQRQKEKKMGIVKVEKIIIHGEVGVKEKKEIEEAGESNVRDVFSVKTNLKRNLLHKLLD